MCKQIHLGVWFDYVSSWIKRLKVYQVIDEINYLILTKEYKEFTFNIIR